jgi:hypothetical protein
MTVDKPRGGEKAQSSQGLVGDRRESETDKRDSGQRGDPKLVIPRRPTFWPGGHLEESRSLGRRKDLSVRSLPDHTKALRGFFGPQRTGASE